MLSSLEETPSTEATGGHDAESRLYLNRRQPSPHKTISSPTPALLYLEATLFGCLGDTSWCHYLVFSSKQCDQLNLNSERSVT
jgi:hypothetical protein